MKERRKKRKPPLPFPPKSIYYEALTNNDHAENFKNTNIFNTLLRQSREQNIKNRF